MMREVHPMKYYPKVLCMRDDRKEMMEQLLHAVRQLEEKVSRTYENETVSFSFFNESFDRLQHIFRLLQQLQSMQIDELKQQMQRLVDVLSERREPETEEVDAVETREEKVSPERVERVELPGYRNPRLNESIHANDSKPMQERTLREETPGITSLNDATEAPPSLLDLKRRISLNDRFLFQRELFHNNREEMNGVMIRLNAFGSYEKAEGYLRESMDWDFDQPVVQDFLRLIKKGFA
ncbi:MAG: Uncharacterized protein XE13_0705 [Proteiniphilum sp. 51_7]|nr:MAG: Uncharacterized protein XE13_0705 [Proteiniphilum sp. 51_7]